MKTPANVVTQAEELLSSAVTDARKNEVAAELDDTIDLAENVRIVLIDLAEYYAGLVTAISGMESQLIYSFS